MPRIAENFIKNKLLPRVDIVRLIQQYVPLKLSGSSYKCCCPFHQEKTPSFVVSPVRQTYKCFGCDAWGNAIDFVMRYKNIDFIEAVEDLAAFAGLDVEYENNGSAVEIKRRIEHNKSYYDLLERLTVFFTQQLPSHARAMDYCLKKRQMTEETIREGRIGYAPNDNGYIQRVICKNSEEIKLCIELGLLRRNKDNTAYIPFFRERLMIPLTDTKGRVIAFGARRLLDVDKSNPKYINSLESPVFKKSQELFGLYECLRANHNRPDKIIVVEGYMDALMLRQYGVNNVVAALGTALTIEHVRLIFRYTNCIVLCFDSDDAGIRASWRALRTATPEINGIKEVRVARLPECDDPDSLVRREGVKAFHKAIDESMPYVDILLASVLQEYSNALDSNEQIRFVCKILSIAKAIAFQPLQSAILHRLCDLFGSKYDIDELRRLMTQVDMDVDFLPRPEDNSMLGGRAQMPPHGAVPQLQQQSQSQLPPQLQRLQMPQMPAVKVVQGNGKGSADAAMSAPAVAVGAGSQGQQLTQGQTQGATQAAAQGQGDNSNAVVSGGLSQKPYGGLVPEKDDPRASLLLDPRREGRWYESSRGRCYAPYGQGGGYSRYRNNGDPYAAPYGRDQGANVPYYWRVNSPASLYNQNRSRSRTIYGGYDQNNVYTADPYEDFRAANSPLWARNSASEETMMIPSKAALQYFTKDSGIFHGQFALGALPTDSAASTASTAKDASATTSAATDVPAATSAGVKISLAEAKGTTEPNNNANENQASQGGQSSQAGQDISASQASQVSSAASQAGQVNSAVVAANQALFAGDKQEKQETVSATQSVGPTLNSEAKLPPLVTPPKSGEMTLEQVQAQAQQERQQRQQAAAVPDYLKLGPDGAPSARTGAEQEDNEGEYYTAGFGPEAKKVQSKPLATAATETQGKGVLDTQGLVGGQYAGQAEAIAKAAVSDITPEERRTYNTVVGLDFNLSELDGVEYKLLAFILQQPNIVALYYEQLHLDDFLYFARALRMREYPCVERLLHLICAQRSITCGMLIEEYRGTMFEPLFFYLSTQAVQVSHDINEEVPVEIKGEFLLQTMFQSLQTPLRMLAELNHFNYGNNINIKLAQAIKGLATRTMTGLSNSDSKSVTKAFSAEASIVNDDGSLTKADGTVISKKAANPKGKPATLNAISKEAAMPVRPAAISTVTARADAVAIQPAGAAVTTVESPVGTSTLSPSAAGVGMPVTAKPEIKPIATVPSTVQAQPMGVVMPQPSPLVGAETLQVKPIGGEVSLQNATQHTATVSPAPQTGVNALQVSQFESEGGSTVPSEPKVVTEEAIEARLRPEPMPETQSAMVAAVIPPSPLMGVNTPQTTITQPEIEIKTEIASEPKAAEVAVPIEPKVEAAVAAATAVTTVAADSDPLSQVAANTPQAATAKPEIDAKTANEPQAAEVVAPAELKMAEVVAAVTAESEPLSQVDANTPQATIAKPEIEIETETGIEPKAAEVAVAAVDVPSAPKAEVEESTEVSKELSMPLASESNLAGDAAGEAVTEVKLEQAANTQEKSQSVDAVVAPVADSLLGAGAGAGGDLLQQADVSGSTFNTLAQISKAASGLGDEDMADAVFGVDLGLGGDGALANISSLTDQVKDIQDAAAAKANATAAEHDGDGLLQPDSDSASAGILGSISLQDKKSKTSKKSKGKKADKNKPQDEDSGMFAFLDDSIDPA